MRSGRSFFTDILILLLCIAGSGLCLFFFWRDINATLYRLGEQPVGTIVFRYNVAQRRFIDRVVWDRLRNESPLYNGDVIRTGDLSEATITFALGDIVDLSPNTLIQIFADSTGAFVDFSGGGISVISSYVGGMVIASGEKRLAVDSGSAVRASSLRGGAMDLSVSEGTAYLESAPGAGGTRVIEAGSGMVLNAAGEELAVPRAAAVYPPPTARFLSQSAEGFPVNFSWNRINYPAGGLTRLEVAGDRSFYRTRFAEESGASAREVVLPEGNWFWRLYPAEGNTPGEVPYSKITIIPNPVPVLISPSEGQVFHYQNRPPSVRFQWSSSPDAFLYNLAAADNPSLQNPAISVQVRAGTGSQLSYLSSALREGVWYWQVTPEYSRDITGSIIPSATQSFVVERGAATGGPVLTAPLDDGLVNIEAGRRDIVFSWKKDSEASSYIVRISPNSNMSSPAVESAGTDTYYRYGAAEAALGPGTWYWTVQPVGPDGELYPASQPRMFTALQGEPVLRQVFPPNNYTAAENILPDMRFTWKTNLADVRFQLSENANFDRFVIDESAPAEAYTIRPLSSGDYYWRITGSAGTQLRESQARRLTVAGSMIPPDLGKPDSGLHASQSGKIYIRDGQPVNFNWGPLQGVEYYAFKIYSGTTQEDPLFETMVYTAGISVNMDDYKDGSYTWTVQGLSRESAVSSRRTGLSASQSIDISHLRPVVLEHPRNGWDYAGIDASRSPDTVRWSSQNPPFNIIFTLARDARMAGVVSSQANAGPEIVLPRLRAGDYYWTVQAQNSEGFDISPSAPSRFRVLPIPPLPAPQNRRPANAHTITPEQIRVSRSVDFTWNEVQGANGYILTIFQNEESSRKLLIQTQVQEETSYTIEDIRLMGRGNFSWQVEAVHVLDEDYIEQRGQLQENRLIVDIPPPRQINTRDSGVLYGK